MEAYKVIESSGFTYLCFARYSNEDKLLKIGVGCGSDFWLKILDETDIRCQFDTVKVQDSDGLFQAIKSSYDSGSLQVTKIAGGLRVNVGSSMEFDLHELTASDRRTELQQLLVGMGRLIEALQTNLTGAEIKIKKLESDNISRLAMPFPEPEVKSKKHAKGVKQPAAVRSIVNPSSKRRKAASGVVFGEDEAGD
ncbi:uncharacterized protein [Dysidea avara]|uniref:uncharacterized protein n=1 Tax=Dysidea avara TaxID=196820 RepID=UPI003319145A